MGDGSPIAATNTVEFRDYALQQGQQAAADKFTASTWQQALRAQSANAQPEVPGVERSLTRHPSGRHSLTNTGVQDLITLGSSTTLKASKSQTANAQRRSLV
jgi:hypothetical protein